MSLLKRLRAELKDITENPPSNCSAVPDSNDLIVWNATIIGPENSVYENGIFHLHITFSEQYPFKPPKVVFITPIYHCNVDNSGFICLDILKDEWSPALTISKVLLSISSLLTDPNPLDPLIPEIAELLLSGEKGKQTHDANARKHTKKYAML